MTDSVSTTSPIFLKLRKWGLPFVLCLSALLAALLAPLYYPGEFQDDVAYVAVSRAMVEGKGYTALFSVTGGLVDITRHPDHLLHAKPITEYTACRSLNTREADQ